MAENKVNKPQNEEEKKKKKGIVAWWLGLSKPLKGIIIGAAVVGVASAITFPILANTVWKNKDDSTISTTETDFYKQFAKFSANFQNSTFKYQPSQITYVDSLGGKTHPNQVVYKDKTATTPRGAWTIIDDGSPEGDLVMLAGETKYGASERVATTLPFYYEEDEDKGIRGYINSAKQVSGFKSIAFESSNTFAKVSIEFNGDIKNVFNFNSSCYLTECAFVNQVNAKIQYS